MGGGTSTGQDLVTIGEIEGERRQALICKTPLTRHLYQTIRQRWNARYHWVVAMGWDGAKMILVEIDTDRFNQFLTDNGVWPYPKTLPAIVGLAEDVTELLIWCN